MPRVPPAATQPVLNAPSYLCFFISGRATLPMVATVAKVSPQTAPKAAQPPTVAMPSPPGNCPIHLSTVLKRLVLIPFDVAQRLPIRTNNGMTMNRYLAVVR